MKKIDRSDKEHLTNLSVDMLITLANATILINTASKEGIPDHWGHKLEADDFKKIELAIDRIAVFIGTFPFLYAYSDYTSVVRFLIQRMNEYHDPTLIERN
jgi:hypothetical protein